jgi:hypothetical protein
MAAVWDTIITGQRKGDHPIFAAMTLPAKAAPWTP